MATLDLLTLVEAKAALDAATSSNRSERINDDELAGYITGTSAYLDSVCGPVVKRNVTDNLDGKYGGLTKLILSKPPVAAVTSVTEYCGTTSTVLTRETGGTVPANGYALADRSGIITRRMGGCDAYWAAGVQNVVVVYSAGRFDSTADVDDKFKLAAKLTLAHMWRREHGMNAPDIGVVGATYTLPAAARELLRGELLGSVPGIA